MQTILEKYLTAENITFLLRSAGISIGIAAAALVCGLVLGVLGAAGRISRNKITHGIATVYVEVIRGTPMMLQILFFYLGVPSIVRAITGEPFNPSVYVIGVVELLQAAKTIGTRTYNYVPPLLMASVIYLALTLTISRFSKRLEERMALSD